MPAVLPEPAIPPDRLELVSSGAQPAQDLNQRAELINLVTKALQQCNVRAHPYDLKTTFTAFGSTSSDGAWRLEDTSPARSLYRWTAEGPSYSAVNLYVNNVLSSSQPAASVPLRLAQVRGIIFFKNTPLGPRASLRSAAATVDGQPVVCVLISHPWRVKSAADGRRWEESEYCVAPASGNLITYSPVPGFYVLFDYSNALHFHDKVIPGKFTVTQGGQAVIQAQVESLSDPQANPALFQPSGLNPVGVGSVLSPPWRYTMMAPAPNPAADPGGAMIVLHGMQPPGSRMIDVEVLGSTNSSLNDAALAWVAHWQGGPPADDLEPGATPQAHEVFLTLHYFNSLAGANR